MNRIVSILNGLMDAIDGWVVDAMAATAASIEPKTFKGQR